MLLLLSPLRTMTSVSIGIGISISLPARVLRISHAGAKISISN